MRFFTLELYEALYTRADEDEGLARLNRALLDYQTHVKESREELGPELVGLSDAFLVDDALVARAKLNLAKDTMELTLRCGNLQVGYFDVALLYERVEIAPSDLQTLSEVSAGTTNHRRFSYDCYAHELSVAEGGQIEHSLLFHPGVEFTIRSGRLTWTRTARPDRKLPRLKSRLAIV